MKRQLNSSTNVSQIVPISSENMEQTRDRITINYYYTIVVLVVTMINLILMVYCHPS